MSDDPSPISENDTPPSAAVILTLEEARILGCLLEKEATTPEHYPLTFKSLQAACNQTSNREPIVRYELETVEEAAESLRYKQLAVLVHQAGARVAKCRHTITQKFPTLTDAQRAILCVLLLRGQQSAAEIRQRTERMHAFASLERVEEVLAEMAARQPQSWVEIIPSGAGRRVTTYRHTLCGQTPHGSAHAATHGGETSPSDTPPSEQPVASWRTTMEDEIAALKSEVEALRTELHELKNSLGAE